MIPNVLQLVCLMKRFDYLNSPLPLTLHSHILSSFHRR